MNANNGIWGSKKTDKRGKIVEAFLEDTLITLINNEQPTHFNSKDATENSIDLTISSATVTDNLDWRVLDNLHDSDYPIQINIDTDFYKKTKKLRPKLKSN